MSNDGHTTTAVDSVRSRVIALERESGLALSPIERLFLATDGTVTDMLESLTRREVSIAILDREVSEDRLYRTVALECEPERTPLVWARSTVQLPPLEDSIAEALVAGDVGIGDVLRNECAETRRELVELTARSEGDEFPSFVESDAKSLLERTYRIHAAGTHVMTITEYFPRGRLSPYRIR
ncbi:chorismate--pyruvate lyase family protein [Halopiger djelfimassiliensis]|uniref:chorismate--pyruvate lyase family protein n=1 Tax=Halopiger djelfimassiliensis TaxID=1293047 RepID=UPI0006776841|nr:chorismate pyruvate-lyase family protein [Halopiger djelfimassiliensis]